MTQFFIGVLVGVVATLAFGWALAVAASRQGEDL